MAAWRRKAEGLFPELREQFAEVEPLTPNLVFFALLPFVRDAHRADDHDALRRAYGYAQWCHHQRAGSELGNAVDVSFYEHLFDDWSLRHHVIPWLSPRVRADLMSLWADRLNAEQLQTLLRLLREDPGARWRELRTVADA